MTVRAIDSASQISRLSMLYSSGLLMFSVVARPFYSWLVELCGRAALEVLLWIAFGMIAAGSIRAATTLSAQRLLAFAALILIATVYAASFKILEERTHLIKYGALAVLLCRDNSRRPFVSIASVAMVGVLTVAILDETVQSFTPGRVGDLRDIGFDLVGGVFGVALWWITLKPSESG
ncbi:MAG: VanZ family protein [Proteobacteria bacterium]|nr:VanZ family protein [Pseudomonadota bacterium]